MLKDACTVIKALSNHIQGDVAFVNVSVFIDVAATAVAAGAVPKEQLDG